MKSENIINKQKRFYAKLYKKHGCSPLAVASGKTIFKKLRYDKLSEVLENDSRFSVHDVGCGLGHYYEYLKKRFPDKKITYSGSEIVDEFVSFCEKRYPGLKFYNRDIIKAPEKKKYDYVVFGGTFYHLCESNIREMDRYVKQSLKRGFAMCRKGMAVNFVTPYCDYFYDELYYPSLPGIIDFTVKNLSRYFTLRHNTPLYEYTLCVSRESCVKKNYRGKDFRKYFKK